MLTLLRRTFEHLAMRTVANIIVCTTMARSPGHNICVAGDRLRLEGFERPGSGDFTGQNAFEISLKGQMQNNCQKLVSALRRNFRGTIVFRLLILSGPADPPM